MSSLSGYVRSLRQGLRTLPVRVTLFLSLALLPIGLLTVYQTLSISRTAQERAELSLIAMTKLATDDHKSTIQRGLSAAKALASVASATQTQPSTCVSTMRRFLGPKMPYAFAGFIDLNGKVVCSASGRAIGTNLAVPVLENSTPELYIDRDPSPLIADAPVLITSHPVRDRSGNQLGAMIVALPMDDLNDRIEYDTDDALQSVTYYLSSGAALFHTARNKSVSPPSLAVKTDIAKNGSVLRVIEGQTEAGTDATYVVLPVIPGQIIAVAGWAAMDESVPVLGRTIPAWLLPIVMWVASLLVAYFAIHRLVVRHVQRMRWQMDRFSNIRFLPSRRQNTQMPQEISDLEAAFSDMAMSLMTEEARMEDALREKTFLMKEIHHRVKNNLQLISSIISMQVRKLPDDEARESMNRLQDRVMGLATVYRCLYVSEDLARIDAADLLSDIVRQSIGAEKSRGRKLSVSKELSSAALMPDQAVPLALLASELLANAVKCSDGVDGATPQIEISFTVEGDDRARLLCRNTTSGVGNGDPGAINGLGKNLMNAFAVQLQADVDTTIQDGWYEVSIKFEIEDEDHADHDY